MKAKPQTILVRLMTGFVLFFVLPISVFAGLPEPAKTEYLKTTGAGFSIDRGKGALYYAMTCQIRKELKAPLYVLVYFQNPEKKGKPFIQYAVLEPNQKVFMAESPTFKRIRNNHSYEVLIILFDDEQRTNLISKHSQQVYFSIPVKLVPKLGIELIK